MKAELPPFTGAFLQKYSKGYTQTFTLSNVAQEKETSKVPIRNIEDVYNALADREIFYKLLQQGPDKENLIVHL